MNWVIAMLVLAAVLIVILGWVCVKGGADAECRSEIQRDKHEGGLLL